ncbi:hypothetical protein Q428_05055 [Fervidicella metallireducens AeB]|uniref:Uncharacterized protein n=1 Tax=Fervidicella metallireducens AeB TaxID=1403537 RepID=A0A017RXC7_9CLOT|nr:hypothetical protein [Fervidicella metallireducens]EYE89029.1 hypothetical protein Q428_05055 [Fervidicella metallireducens AeB]
MRVCYDKKHDVVSIYYESYSEISTETSNYDEAQIGNRTYEPETAANLIIDMVDLIDSNGNLKGFRVFNASKYYSIELLNYAESEELSEGDLNLMTNERVIMKLK